MVEREEAWQFLYEYAHATGIDMELIAVGERPDFACEKDGQRYGLELVKVMQNPETRRAKQCWERTRIYTAPMLRGWFKKSHYEASRKISDDFHG